LVAGLGAHWWASAGTVRPGAGAVLAASLRRRRRAGRCGGRRGGPALCSVLCLAGRGSPSCPGGCVGLGCAVRGPARAGPYYGMRWAARSPAWIRPWRSTAGGAGGATWRDGGACGVGAPSLSRMGVSLEALVLAMIGVNEVPVRSRSDGRWIGGDSKEDRTMRHSLSVMRSRHFGARV